MEEGLKNISDYSGIDGLSKRRPARFTTLPAAAACGNQPGYPHRCVVPDRSKSALAFANAVGSARLHGRNSKRRRLARAARYAARQSAHNHRLWKAGAHSPSLVRAGGKRCLNLSQGLKGNPCRPAAQLSRLRPIREIAPVPFSALGRRLADAAAAHRTRVGRRGRMGAECPACTRVRPQHPYCRQFRACATLADGAVALRRGRPMLESAEFCSGLEPARGQIPKYAVQSADALSRKQNASHCSAGKYQQ